VVGDLEQVPASPVVGHVLEQVQVVVVLEIAGEQQALLPQPNRKHDGGAVDGAAVGEHPIGEGLARRPEHIDLCMAERKRVALHEADPVGAVTPGCGAQLLDAGALAVHGRLGEATHAIARSEAGEATGVVFVRMGQHGQVDVTVPDRDALVEPAHEQVRVRSAIDEHALAVRLEQHRVTLADVEHAHTQLRPG
jgi:hypothetical protein